MQRWQGAALAVVLCAGCLDPLVDDEPGYSRYVLAPASAVPSAYDDPQINRKIDVNDGLGMGNVAVKSGFAGGQAVRYWDFGASKRSSNASYGVANCSGGVKTPTGHPLIVDNIPGDTDYSPFRAPYWACTTPKYKGEIIPSLDAFYDAIDLGLITDPTSENPPYWVNQPVVAANVGLTFSNGTVAPAAQMFYRGKVILHHSFETQEGTFPYVDKNVPTGNVYELMKPGQMTPARVIFSQPYWMAGEPEAAPSRNPMYSANWLVVTVTLKAQTMPMNDAAGQAAALDALIDMFKQESDFVAVGMNNAFTLKNREGDPLKDAVTKGISMIAATMNRVNRPFIVNDMEAAP